MLAEGYLPRTFFARPKLLRRPLNLQLELGRVSTLALQKANNSVAMQLVEEIMAEILREASKPNVEIKQHSEMEQELYKCFEFMHIYFKPSPVHFNFLIEFHSGSTNRNLDNALLVLRNACSLGLSKDMAQACSVLIRRCHPDSSGPASPQHIKEILEIMEFYEIQPDASILATAIDAYIKVGELDKAKTLFDDLEVVYNINPNVVMYGSIIQGFSNANDLVGALSIYWKMLSKNVKPNSRTILKLLTAVSKKAVEAQTSGEINPNVKGITLSEIIDQLSEGLLIAEDLDEEFEEKSMTTVLSALARSSNVALLKRCIDFFDQMKIESAINDKRRNASQVFLTLKQVLRASTTLHEIIKEQEEKEELLSKASKIFGLIEMHSLPVDETCIYFYLRLFMNWKDSPRNLNVVYQAFKIFKEFEVNVQYYKIDAVARAISECYEKNSELSSAELLDRLTNISAVPVFD